MVVFDGIRLLALLPPLGTGPLGLVPAVRCGDAAQICPVPGAAPRGRLAPGRAPHPQNEVLHDHRRRSMHPLLLGFLVSIADRARLRQTLESSGFPCPRYLNLQHGVTDTPDAAHHLSSLPRRFVSVRPTTNRQFPVARQSTRPHRSIPRLPPPSRVPSLPASLFMYPNRCGPEQASHSPKQERALPSRSAAPRHQNCRLR